MNAIKLIEMINDNDGELTARSYSGRAMYGRQCVGVTCENMFAAIAAITASVDWTDDEDLMRDWLEALAETCSDSMGRDAIIYWPRIEWPAGMVERDDEEGDDE